MRPVDIVAAKQTYKAPTTIKVGDKEVVRMRAFTILSTTLTLTPTGFADAVPPFDPLKLTDRRGRRPTRRPIPGRRRTTPKSRFRTRSHRRRRGAATGELTLAEAQAQVARR